MFWRSAAILALSTLGATAALAAQPLSPDRRLAELRKSPPELYDFLYRMPKGGDLHNHLSGAIYAEDFLSAAIEEHLCIDKAALAFIPCGPGQTEASAIQTDNPLRNSLIDAFSMRNFVAGRQSGHDHFFDTFNLFGAAGSGNLIAGVVQRAADQNESYLELMALSGGPVAALGKAVGLTGDFDATRKQLEGGGLAKYVAALSARVDEMERTRIAKLGCGQTRESPACLVQVRYVYQVLREFPKEQVFAQVIAGFAAAAADSRIVGVNFVQAEDGYASMHDYGLHMKMVDYARSLYPKVHIALHAGELAPGLVPPDGLRFHIREALDIGHAERIGHGVDVMYERDPIALLKEMRDRHTLVEINLTSNDVILGVKGDEHPLPVYRKYGVPTALSTDDEGVSRSQLTEEFKRAVLTYNLSYSDLKEMARNSIEYSFAPGDSYWKDHRYTAVAAPCAAVRKSPGCQAYLEKNDKARLGADLEERFSAFERSLN
ncbi:MAG: adenosine deaminase [Acidobacteriota bacterium]|nr:adenosine deaminase [Acidobacteriota bacterium]